MPKPFSEAAWNKALAGSSSGLAKSPWPAPRCDSMRTGQSLFPGPRDPEIKWTYRLPLSGSGGVAVGPDGTIYLATGDYLAALTSDGKKKWRRKIPSPDEPCVTSGGDIVVLSLRRRIHCFSANGKPLWLAPTPMEAEDPTPYVVGPDGTVYVGDSRRPEKGRLRAVAPGGRVKWTAGTGMSIAPPAIDQSGRIWFGESVISPSGKQVDSWSVGAAADQGFILGPGGVSFWSEDWSDYDKVEGDVSARAPDFSWHHRYTDSVPGSMALSRRGILYVIGEEIGDDLVALNAWTGKLLWRADGDIPSIDVEGTAYWCAGRPTGLAKLLGRASNTTSLEAIRPDGTTAWRLNLEGGGYWDPAIGSGRTLLVATSVVSSDSKVLAATLYCVGER